MREIIISLLFLMLTCGFAIGQKTLLLTDAINIALKNSLDIQIAKNNLDASINNNHLSIAGGMPIVSGNLSNNHSITNFTQELSNGTKTQRNNVSSNAINAGINGSFILYNGLRVHFSKERLTTLTQQNEILINEQVQNVIAAVMIKYFDIVRQQGYLKTINEALSVTLQRKRLLEIKQSVGLANDADKFQAQLDSTTGIQEIRSQQLILDQAKADLMGLLNLHPDSSFTIQDTILVDNSINIDSVKAKIKLNPLLLSSEKQIRINELIAKETGSQRYPAVLLNGGYTLNRNQNSAGLNLLNQTIGPFLGLGINIPLFNGGLIKRQQQAAEFGIKNEQLTKQKIANSLETEAVRNYYAYKATLLQLNAERENNKTAAALLNLVYQRYELGVGTVVDLRTAQQSYLEAGFRLINLSYAAKVAEIALKRITSSLIP